MYVRMYVLYTVFMGQLIWYAAFYRQLYHQDVVEWKREVIL